MRDPALIPAFLFATVAIQLLLWSITRNSCDLPWLVAFLLAFVTIQAGLILRALDFKSTNVAACYLGSVLAVWIVSEIFYPLATWQRLALSAVSPLLGFVGLVAGLAIRKSIFGF